MRKDIQADRIMKYIADHGSITSDDAKDHLGVARLASRICDLKHGAYVKYGEVPIIAVREECENRFGEPTHRHRYYLGSTMRSELEGKLAAYRG